MNNNLIPCTAVEEGTILTMRRNHWNLAGFLFIACVAMAATACCDSGLDKVVLTGTVTYQGELLPNGDIMFCPVDDTPGPVAGGPIKNGQYTVEGKDGVVVGAHRVQIRAYRPWTGSTLPPEKRNDPELRRLMAGSREQYLPDKYSSPQSELIATIESSSAPVQKDFQLK